MARVDIIIAMSPDVKSSTNIVRDALTKTLLKSRQQRRKLP